jgi:archaellum biogenesis ATPase FlaH
VPMNSITMFFGEEKSGKSLLVTYILKCVANGEKVFGVLPVDKRPVLYLDRENSNDDIAGMSEHFVGLGTEEIRYRTRETNCPEPDSPGLIAFCERYKPLIVFDSLTKFAKDVDVFNPAEMSALFDKLLDLCAAGATVIIIHHATKADAEKYANSHQIGANVSRAFAVISRDRPKLHHVRLEAKLFRGAEPANFNLIAFPVISRHGCFGLEDGVTTDLDIVIEWMLERYPQGCMQEVIKKEMSGMSNGRKVAAIKDGIECGRLRKTGGILYVADGVPERRDAENKKSPSPSTGTGADEVFDFNAKTSVVN